MKLDHLSYVTSHDQLSDTVQRLGSRIGCTFVDGGIHPRFGTRNFTAPLLNGQYIEVVCPLDHPATEQSPWGKAVLKKSLDGGGWFSWVFSTSDLSVITNRFGRSPIEAQRTRPNGTSLLWKQIGVKEIIDSPELPFFIEWMSGDHPSKDGVPVTSISKLVIADSNELEDSWFKQEILDAMNGVEIEWFKSQENDSLAGLIEVYFKTEHGVVIID